VRGMGQLRQPAEGRPVRGRTRAAWPLTRASVVVGTGVDPVTYRFSGGRSAN
jgi:hypothetical protein